MISFLVVVAGFMPLNSNYLKNIAQEKLLELGADSVHIGYIAVTVWSGVRIRDVSVRKIISPTESYHITLGTISVRANIISAAYELLVRKTFTALEQEDYFSLAYHSPLDAVNEVAEFMGLIGSMRAVALAGGELVLIRGAKKSTKVADVSINCKRNSPNHLTGSLRCGVVAVPENHSVKNFSADFLLEGPLFHLVNGRGDLLGGEVRLGAEVDLVNRSVLGANLRASNIDLSQLYREPQQGTVEGRADITFQFAPGSLCFSSIAGQGTLGASGVHLSRLPFQRTLITALVASGFSELYFDTIQSDFELSSGKVVLESTGKGGDLWFKAKGWVNSDMVMDQQIEGELSEEFASQLPAFMAATLERSEDGGRVFKFHLYGPADEPRLEIDKDQLRGVVRRGFSELRRSVRGSRRR